MIVFIPKGKNKIETRVSATPDSVKDLIKLGIEVHVESKAGEKSFISDDDSLDKGAIIVDKASELFKKPDTKVLGVMAPELDNIKMMKKRIAVIHRQAGSTIMSRH